MLQCALWAQQTYTPFIQSGFFPGVVYLLSTWYRRCKYF